MTKTCRGYIAWRRRTKMRSFAVGWARALTGTSLQYQIKALYSAHRDRGRQKRNSLLLISFEHPLHHRDIESNGILFLLLKF